MFRQPRVSKDSSLLHWPLWDHSSLWAVAYRIRLPERFSAVHNVFHVSQLRKCAHEPAREVIEEADAWIEPDLSVVEHPLRILYVKERKTRRQSVKMYKIQWSHHTIEEATWETEHYLNENYPGFLESSQSKFLPLIHLLNPNLGTRFLLRGVGCNIPDV
jgi:hypothetical protein